MLLLSPLLSLCSIPLAVLSLSLKRAAAATFGDGIVASEFLDRKIAAAAACCRVTAKVVAAVVVRISGDGGGSG